MAFRLPIQAVAATIKGLGRRDGAAQSMRRCRFNSASRRNNSSSASATSLSRPKAVERRLASRATLARGEETRRGVTTRAASGEATLRSHQRLPHQRRLEGRRSASLVSDGQGCSSRQFSAEVTDKGWEESPGYFIRGGGEGGEDGDPGPPPPLDKSIVTGPTEKVLEVMEAIDSLNFIELNMLTELMAEKMGLDEIPTLSLPGEGGGGGGGGGGGAGGEEEQAAKTLFNLTLTGFGDKAKIKVIKEIRGITGLGLREAKELAEELPKVIKADVNKEEGEKFVEQLEKAGATVELA